MLLLLVDIRSRESTQVVVVRSDYWRAGSGRAGRRRGSDGW